MKDIARTVRHFAVFLFIIISLNFFIIGRAINKLDNKINTLIKQDENINSYILKQNDNKKVIFDLVNSSVQLNDKTIELIESLLAENNLYQPIIPDRRFIPEQSNWFTQDHNRLLDAIAIVESNSNPNAVGDSGNALGAYQIWNAYWKDALEYDPSIGGSYDQVKDPEYARKIIIAYWSRYGASVNYSLEGLARIHNGGSTGYRKESTVRYWEKIKEILNRDEN